MNIGTSLHLVNDRLGSAAAPEGRLDALFFALSDPVRRRILERLDGQALLVSEIAAPFAISLQAVSRHIQVLVRAGLIQQERSGRISRCSLDALGNRRTRAAASRDTTGKETDGAAHVRPEMTKGE